MKRTTIFLTPQQIQKIRSAAKKTGLKPAELIRRWVDAGLKEHQ